MKEEKYIMYYEIKEKNNKLRILGEEFVKNNKNKGRIIYKNKIYPLQDLFLLKNIKDEKLKIYMLLSKNCCNKSSMFNNCTSLVGRQGTTYDSSVTGGSVSRAKSDGGTSSPGYFTAK